MLWSRYRLFLCPSEVSEVMRKPMLLMIMFLIASIAWMNWRDPLFPPTREITVVARNMAFVVADSDSVNPDIHCTGRERIAFLFRNEDAGVKHDFAVPDLKVRSRVLVAGQSQRLVMTMPAGPALYAYQCNIHVKMMRGRIIINQQTAPSRLNH